MEAGTHIRGGNDEAASGDSRPPGSPGAPRPAAGQPGPGTAVTPAPPAVRAQEPPPPPAPTPQPGLRGRHHEVNSGNFDLVDGIAWPAKDGSGTVVYATSKPIASSALAGSPCPMTGCER